MAGGETVSPNFITRAGRLARARQPYVLIGRRLSLPTPDSDSAPHPSPEITGAVPDLSVGTRSLHLLSGVGRHEGTDDLLGRGGRSAAPSPAAAGFPTAEPR